MIMTTSKTFAQETGIGYEQARSLLMRYCKECGLTNNTLPNGRGFSNRKVPLYQIGKEEIRNMLEYATSRSVWGTRKQSWKQIYNKLTEYNEKIKEEL